MSEELTPTIRNLQRLGDSLKGEDQQVCYRAVSELTKALRSLPAAGAEPQWHLSQWVHVAVSCNWAMSDLEQKIMERVCWEFDELQKLAGPITVSVIKYNPLSLPQPSIVISGPEPQPVPTTVARCYKVPNEPISVTYGPAQQEPGGQPYRIGSSTGAAPKSQPSNIAVPICKTAQQSIADQPCATQPEVEALRRDAERYRWLRVQMATPESMWIARGIVGNLSCWNGAKADTLIDAALAASRAK